MPRFAWHPIRGHPQYEINRRGEIRSKRSGQVLKPWDDCRGYLRVRLDGQTLKVHILVASAFVPNPDPARKTIVNHKTGDKHDNRASQLEWVSPSENTKHAWAMGLIKARKGGSSA